MKKIIRVKCLLLLIIAASCNQQGMSDEHRQKLKQESADRKILRATEADILNAAKEKAQKVYKLLLAHKDSALISKYQIKWLGLQDSTSSQYEEQMQEAYQYVFDQNLKLNDNIEDLDNGSIIYTKPSIKRDSSQGFWIIILDKKVVIRQLQ